MPKKKQKKQFPQRRDQEVEMHSTPVRANPTLTTEELSKIPENAQSMYQGLLVHLSNIMRLSAAGKGMFVRSTVVESRAQRLIYLYY